jgi:hypothetical protein
MAKGLKWMELMYSRVIDWTDYHASDEEARPATVADIYRKGLLITMHTTPYLLQFLAIQS